MQEKVRFPVSMALKDMVYLSYRIAPERVRPLVPEHIPLAIMGENVYLSVVAFRNVAVGFANHPFLPFTYTQINVRTYAVHPQTGEKGPYFLRCALTSRFMLAGVRLLGYEWEPLKMASEHVTTGRQKWCMSMSGELDGPFAFDVCADDEKGRDARVLSEGVEDTLINLFVGFFPMTQGVGVVPVSHTHLGMREGRMREMTFPCLERMGIMNPDEAAHPESVVLVDRALFTIYLPPVTLAAP